jgi:hypothetical protein
MEGEYEGGHARPEQGVPGEVDVPSHVEGAVGRGDVDAGSVLVDDVAQSEPVAALSKFERTERP